MKTEIETPTPKDSPFTFDVWQCPNCQWAMSNEAHNASRLDYDCPNCSVKKLSEFELRKARRD